MRYRTFKTFMVLLIVGFLHFSVSDIYASTGAGDGRILKRSLEDTCHACHKTNRNVSTSDSNWQHAIKTHNSDFAGRCSNTAYLNRFDCEANGETWSVYWAGNGGWGKTGAKYGEIVCTTCHTTHNTKNIYLIRETITTPDGTNWAWGTTSRVTVDFRYLSGTAGVTPGTMGDDTGGHSTSNRICEVCHSQTSKHRYNTAGQSGGTDHQNAVNCKICHKHQKGFNPDFAASCGDCHGYPISTNFVSSNSNGLVVADIAYAPSGETGRRTQFANAKGAHVTHYNKGAAGCNQCHYDGMTQAPPDPKFDDKFQIGFYLTTTLGGNYSAPAFSNTKYTFQQTGTTSVSVSGSTRTCSNLYCHSDAGNYAGTTSYRTVNWDDTLASPTCDKCHGNQSGTYVTTDKHPQHINASTYNFKCNECHSATVDANNSITDYSKHLNKTKDIAWGPLSTGGGAYTKGGANGDCSSTYCHSSGTKASNYGAPETTVRWNTGTLTCTGCHRGNAASGKPMATLAHSGHINDTDNEVGRNIGCAECHDATVSSDTTLIGPPYTNHVNRKINVRFDSIGTTTWYRSADTPTYAGQSARASDNPGAQKDPETSNYTCSNIYCHSIGNLDSSGNLVAGDGLTYRTINWNGAAINCTGCHGDGSTKSHPVYTNGGSGSNTANSHIKHVDDNLYACDYCHIGTTTSTSLPPTTVVQGTLHINRQENVLFNTTKAGSGASYNATSKTCSSVYCHATIMTWGNNNSTNCATCHDNQGGGGSPDRYTAKHQTHVDTTGYSFSCEMCHSALSTDATVHAGGPASGTNPGGDAVGAYQSTEIRYTDQSVGSWTTGSYRGSAKTTYKYRSMKIDPYTGNSITPTYADGPQTTLTDQSNVSIKYTFGTCNNIWCHSNAAPGGTNTFKSVTWNATLDCGSCHNKAGDSSPNWSAPHTKHINSYSANTNLTCNSCHNATTSSNTIVSNKAKHVDGAKDVQFNTWTGGSWGGNQCSNTYCHSKGTDIGAGPYTHSSINWTGSVGCGGCHGEGASNGNPSYANGSPKANSHVKHVVSYSYTCEKCHVNVANATPAIINTSLHVNKAYNVDFATYGGKTGTYNYGAKTCSSTYCHGTPASIAWGTTANCESCHKANNTGSGLSSAHIKHYDTTTLPTQADGWANTNASTTSANIYKCGTCHNVPGSHANGPASSYSDAQVSFSIPFGGGTNTSTPGTTSSTDGQGFKFATNTSCSVYCHSNGQATWTASSAIWGATNLGCDACHSAPATSSRNWSTPHDKHTRGAYDSAAYSITCNYCHNATTSSNTIVSNKAKHVDGARDVQFNTWTGGSWGGNQCSNTYCHSKGTDIGTGPYTHSSINWTGSVGCGGCHGEGASNGSPSTTVKANSHPKHVSSLGYTCEKCHVNVANATPAIINKSLHVNKAYNVDFATIGGQTGTYNYGAKTCSSTYCHGTGTPTWGGTIGTNCTDCHGFAPNTYAHATHVQDSTLLTKVYGSTEVVSSLSNYAFGCGNCHPDSSSSSLHSNGLVEVTLSPAAGGTLRSKNSASWNVSGSGATLQCYGAYCHSNGASNVSDGANLTYKTVQWNATFSTNKCGQCHDNPPQYVGQSHYVASNFMGREGGHLIGIHWDNIFNGSNGRATAGNTNTSSHGNAGTSTTIACYICHNGIVSSTTIDTYALNNLGSSEMKCNNTGCHSGATNPPQNQNGVITNKNLHVNGSKDVALVNPSGGMKSKAQLRSLPSSLSSIWTRNIGYKVAGAYDVATINAGDWNSGTKTCTTACHNNIPIEWGSLSVTCASCHNELP